MPEQQVDGTRVHRCPQRPQWCGSVDTSTQLPEQQVSCAAQTLSHVPQWLRCDRVSTQVPRQHVSPVAHALPHMPQCASSELRSTHAPEQHHVPPEQTGPLGPPHRQVPPKQLIPRSHVTTRPPPHTPAVHVSPIVHGLPSSQEEPFERGVWTHPVAGWHESSVHGLPSSHERVAPPRHVSPTHASPTVHALPSSHEPPLARYVQPEALQPSTVHGFASSHRLPHIRQWCSVSPRVSHPAVASQSSHGATHTHRPSRHTAFAPHAPPHRPQWSRDASRSVSQPSMSSPLQFPKPGAHDAIVHISDSQLAVAFARMHRTPQPPQFDRVVRLVSQTVSDRPSHSPVPGGHVSAMQVPPSHRMGGVPAGHLRPHTPQ